MAFQHGVVVTEQPTRISPAAPVDSALPFVVGTAPVLSLAAAARPVNRAVLCPTYESFVAAFGDIPDGEAEGDYSLSQFARIYFGLYGAAPAVFVNVYDPVVHTNGVSDVAAADVVGGVTVGGRKGIELVEMVFPLFGRVVASVLAPGFSQIPAVAGALTAKATADVGGLWNTQALIDIPDDAVDPVAWKGEHCSSPHAYAVWGSLVASDGTTHPASAHVAGLLAQADRANGGLPFVSPSNRPYSGVARATKPLTDPEANLLNAGGVATSLRSGPGALRLWGNRTTAFPEVRDVKDTFLPTRRMTNYLLNVVALTLKSRVDGPLNRRQLEGAVDEVNILLTQMVGAGALAGGRAAAYAEDNPPLELANGKAKIRIYFAPTPPSETIEIVAEVDVAMYDSVLA